MSRGAVAAALALATFGACAATAAAQVRTAPLRASGAITVAWRGDEARGCAAAGLCGVEGRAVLSLAAEGSLFVPREDARTLFGYVFGGGSDTVVRVVRRTGVQPPPVCTDAPGGGVGPGGVSVNVSSPRRGPVRVALDASSALSAGRCAGPLPGDLAGALPTAEVPAARLLAGPGRVDLGGRRGFIAGPFRGEVVSSVVLRVGALRPRRASVRRSRPRRPARRRVVRRVRTLRLDYAVRRERGTLRSSFTGLVAGDCEALDACGLAGAMTLAPGLRGVTLRLRSRGEAVTGPDSVTRALRDIRARRLALRTGVGQPVTARLAAETRRAGVAGVCRDASGRGGLRLQLRRSGDALRARLRAMQLFPAASALRTRCPGPGIAPDTVVAEGRLPLRSLGARRLVLRLRATGRDPAPGFAAAPREGTVVLELRRTAARAGSFQSTRRVR